MLIKVTTLDLADFTRLADNVPTILAVLVVLYSGAFFLVLKAYVRCGNDDDDADTEEKKLKDYAQRNGMDVGRSSQGQLMLLGGVSKIKAEQLPKFDNADDELVLEDLVECEPIGEGPHPPAYEELQKEKKKKVVAMVLRSIV